MRRFRNLKIQPKLTLITMLVAGVALLLVSSILAVNQHVTERSNLLDQVTTTAAILADNSAAALSFDDQASAAQTLAGLRADKGILGAAVYDRAGRRFVVLCDGCDEGELVSRGATMTPGHRFGREVLEVVAPIVAGGERIGRIYVQADLNPLRRRLWRYGAIIAVGMLTASVVAFVLSSRMLAAVTSPISHLARVVRRVAVRKNYSLRALKHSDDELGALIDGFNDMLGEIQARDHALREAHDTLEARVEERTQSLRREIAVREQVEAALRGERGFLKALIENLHAVPWEMDPDQRVCTYIGPQVERQWGWPTQRFAATGFLVECIHESDRAAFDDALRRLPQAGALELELRIRRGDGGYAYVRNLLSLGSDGRSAVRGIGIDVTAQKKLEDELRQAQKLESVGRLAAGIAHEINTPVQYVNDSCHFLRDAVADLHRLVHHYRAAVQSLAVGAAAPQDVLEELRAAEESADLGYLLDHMPSALDNALDGLQRVATIVRSMKEFAHPARKQQSHADINRAIVSTLTIARNEYKYVADVHTDLGELPPVPCYLGDLNQVILNIVVNAAHAIEDAVRGSDRRGVISVRTAVDGDAVAIAIADTGNGIPEQIRHRIFDPFFTTKEVGRGTGQGLAIAHTIVVERHRGSIEVDSRTGEGTTFTIRLPLNPPTAMEMFT